MKANKVTLTENDFSMPKGFIALGMEAGIKKNNLPDFGLILSLEKATASGVFTTSQFKGHCIDICRERLKNNQTCHGVVVTSGNSNTATGPQGRKDSEKILAEVYKSLPPGLKKNIQPASFLISHTGVIGQRLPMTNILKNIPRIETKLNQTLEIESQKEVSKMEGFARAIMTTDTRMKMIKAVIEFAKGKKDGSPSEISISGVAKGSGMIAPGMATMLSYIITDAGIRKKDAQSMLEKAVASSFNSITVDGDMSPDDSVIMLANGASNIQLTKENLPIFQNALNLVTAYLAREIIKDGEGATKIIQIQIQGAEDHTQAKKAALAIANSLLVKTAFFGEDANWGRILTALGYSGCSFTLSRVNLFFGKYQLCKNGQGVVFDETELKAYLKNKEINIFLKLGKGKGQAKVLTTDLSYDYVRINADYRS